MRISKLVEMSQLVDYDFSKANEKLKRILAKYNLDEFKLIDKSLKLYESGNSIYEKYFIIFNNEKNEIDFIIQFKQDAVKIENTIIKCLTPIFVYKKNMELKSVTKKVYKKVNQLYQKPILSDKKQTKEMSLVWIKMLEDKSIPFVKIVDTQTNEILEDIENTEYGIFDYFEQGQRYRIILNFGELIIKEDEFVKEMREKYPKYFK